MDIKLIDRVIDVLDLELDVDLADPEWDAVIDKKLSLLVDLKKLKKGQDEPHQRTI